MADETDGRGVIVELTEKGRLLVESAMRDHAETERRLVVMLPATEQIMVAGALGRMSWLAAKRVGPRSANSCRPSPT